jgi:hypothetical protein
MSLIQNLHGSESDFAKVDAGGQEGRGHAYTSRCIPRRCLFTALPFNNVYNKVYLKNVVVQIK